MYNTINSSAIKNAIKGFSNLLVNKKYTEMQGGNKLYLEKSAEEWRRKC